MNFAQISVHCTAIAYFRHTNQFLLGKMIGHILQYAIENKHYGAHGLAQDMPTDQVSTKEEHERCPYVFLNVPRNQTFRGFHGQLCTTVSISNRHVPVK